ncbi:hypothetical protein ACM66B_002092 [Microbotryomycetes sp. NB124-2]
MRAVVRWTAHPPRKPPPLHRRTAYAAPSQETASSSAAVPLPSQPATTARAQARQTSTRPHQTSWTSTSLAQALSLVLKRAPRPNKSRLRSQHHMTITDMLDELPQWRLACWKAYTLMSQHMTPQQRARFESAVASLVGQAMRVFINAARPREARELERAFFTTLPARDSWAKGKGRSEDSDHERTDLSLSGHHLALGTGLGLNRASSSTTWVPTLDLRASTSLQDPSLSSLATLDQIGALITDMQSQATAANRDKNFSAHLERFANKLRARLVERGIDPFEADFLVLRHLSLNKEAAYGTLSLRDMAALDIMLDQIELASAADEDSRECARVVVDRLQQRVGQSIDAFANWIESQETSASDYPLDRSERLHKQAEKLHIAVRLCLVQGDLSNAAAVRRQSFERACGLYRQSISLLRHCKSTRQFVDVRQRQTSSLVRVVWAGIGSTAQRASTRSERDRGLRSMTGPVSSSQLEMTLDVVRETVATLQHLTCVRKYPDAPANSQLVGLDEVFWRELIFSLRPRRTRSSSDGALEAQHDAAKSVSWTTYDWSTVRHALETILYCRRHDSGVLSFRRNESRATNNLFEPASSLRPLLERTSYIMALVRLVLLSSESSSSSSSSLPDIDRHQQQQRRRSSTPSSASTISQRVDWLLKWVDKLQYELGRASTSIVAQDQLQPKYFYNKRQTKLDSSSSSSPSSFTPRTTELTTFKIVKDVSLRTEITRPEIVTRSPILMSALRKEVVKRKMIKLGVEQVVAQEWGSKGHREWTSQVLKTVEEWNETRERQRDRARATVDQQSPRHDERDTRVAKGSMT